MAKKQTRSPASTLAANVLAGRVQPTQSQIKTLAATALSQDETRGQTPKKRK